MRSVVLLGLGVSVVTAFSCSDPNANSGSSGAVDTGGTLATGGFHATGGVLGTGGALAAGGSASTGGMAAIGGTATATGGAMATGGSLATGGLGATGGLNATGGALGTGGAPATGGAAAATGGAVATGGATTATGGVAATGGATTSDTGGAVATGGAATATGGVAATGGTPATGGLPATGGTTATPGVMTIAPSNYITDGPWQGYGYSILGNPVAGDSVVPDCTTTCTPPITATTGLCASGTLNADATYKSAAGVGFAVNQAVAGGTIGSIAVTGTGLKVTYTNTGTNTTIRVQISSATDDYCFDISAATSPVKIPWSSFHVGCYNTPQGAAFTTATPITKIALIVPSSNAVNATFNVCLNEASSY